MTFQLDAKDARERIESLRTSCEAIELFTCESFRDASKLVYEARLRLSEALSALPSERVESTKERE